MFVIIYVGREVVHRIQSTRWPLPSTGGMSPLVSDVLCACACACPLFVCLRSLVGLAEIVVVGAWKVPGV